MKFQGFFKYESFIHNITYIRLDNKRGFEI